MQSYQVNVTAAGKALLAGDTKGGGGEYRIKNTHASVALLLGGDENETPSGAPASTLSATTGYSVAAGAEFTARVNGGEALYGLSSNSTVSITAHVLRINRQVR